MGSRVSVSEAVAPGEMMAPGESTPSEPGSASGAGTKVFCPWSVTSEETLPALKEAKRVLREAHLSVRATMLPSRRSETIQCRHPVPPRPR